MTKIPAISKEESKKHAGESAAIVDGKIIAFAKDSYEVRQTAEKMGYKSEDIMTVFIMGPQPHALHFSIL
jgi:hypothetical protein